MKKLARDQAGTSAIWHGQRRRLSWRIAGQGAAALLTMLAALAVASGGTLRADAGAFEQRKIAAQAQEAFIHIINLWREEVYFELYDSGMETSKARISREEFARRMVQLDWIPQGDLNPKFLKAEYRFRTVVYVSARITYRNKFDAAAPFARDQTMLMLEENGAWHIDLIQLIRSPYVE